MSTAPLVELEARAWQAWRPPRRLSLSAWADAHFLLPEGDANAGRWRTLPYQRGILDALTDPGIERVWVMKSARVGWTKACTAAACYYIDHDPCPILIVQPAVEDAEGYSKEDLAPILEAVPAVAARISEPRAKDSSNTILHKLFPGGVLSLIGANSPRGFRRVGRRVVIFDEVDEYPVSVGTQGDPITLGVRRTEYYWNRKILGGSTPTIAGYSRIEALFEDGDQRRYYVPCPSCGAFQVLRFPNLKWPQGRPEAADFVCEPNGCVIEERRKRDMIEAGEWRAEAPEHFTPEHRVASFHLWAGYSYSPNATWGQLAAEFVKANREGAESLKTFVNTVLGETWKDRGEAPEWERLMRRRSPYTIGTVPGGALFLTAGVDVQKDRLIYEVVGWGRGKASWSIDYGILPGNTADRSAKGPWAQLDAVLERTFPHEHGRELGIRMLAIDSGYNTQVVYGWARRHPMSRVIAVKGQPSGSVLIGTPSAVDVTHQGKKLAKGYRVWPVCGHVAKSELYGWLRLETPAAGEPPPPGFCHFPEYDEEYFRGLTAEQLVTHRTRAGFVRLEWTLIPGRENHPLDCRVYARAAAALVGLDRFREVDWARLEALLGIPPASPPESPVPASSPPGGGPPAPPPGPPSPRPRRVFRSRYLGA